MALKHLIKYLLGTSDWAWSFGLQRPPGELHGVGDSDWAQDPKTRKSVSSGVLLRGRHVWEHWVIGQQLIGLSSGEAEFYAGGKAAAHGRCFVFLMAEAGRRVLLRVRTDSSAALGAASRLGAGKRLRGRATSRHSTSTCRT